MTTPDPLTVAVERLDADLAAIEQVRDANQQAQARARVEQRWLDRQAAIEGST